MHLLGSNMKATSIALYGHRFRSRLEAQFAALFTLAGVSWEYEPAYGGYFSPKGWLPDFALFEEEYLTLVEVKPPMSDFQLRWVKRKIDRALASATIPVVPRERLPWVSVWITNGGFPHLGTDAYGCPVRDVGVGISRSWRYAHWTPADLWLVLPMTGEGREMAPHGSLQLGFAWGGSQVEFSVDTDPTDTNLPIGCKTWGEAWRKATRIVNDDGRPCDAPPNPREWLDVRDSDECPDCGDHKTPGYMQCLACYDG